MHKYILWIFKILICGHFSHFSALKLLAILASKLLCTSEAVVRKHSRLLKRLKLLGGKSVNINIPETFKFFFFFAWHMVARMATQ